MSHAFLMSFNNELEVQSVMTEKYLLPKPNFIIEFIWLVAFV